MKLATSLISKNTKGVWLFISLMFVLLISMNSYLSRSTVIELTALQRDIRESSQILNALKDIHVNLLTAESGQRGFLLTKDARYLQHYTESMSATKLNLNQVKELALSQEGQIMAIRQLAALVESKLAEMQTTVEKARDREFSEAINIVETDRGLQLYVEIHEIFDAIQIHERKNIDKQIDILRLATDSSGHNLTVSFITSLILVIGVFLLARLNIRTQVLRQQEMQSQNNKLKLAVDERTKELSLFAEELSRSNRELEDFAFVASHDLQEPLRKIMAFGDRLNTQAANLNEKQQDYLKRMRGAAERMSVLISDLLEFSRINRRGKAFQQVDLNAIIANSVDDLSVLIEESNTKIQLDNLPVIDADPTQMQQLFFNLIANGIKFSQHQEQPCIELMVEPVSQPSNIEIEGLSEWYRFSIKDNGIGFEQEHAEKIFAPFQRLHSRTEFKGTGIGLAICRRIVERHNGEIQALGKTNEGAVFTVTLPAQNYLLSIKQ